MQTQTETLAPCVAQQDCRNHATGRIDLWGIYAKQTRICTLHGADDTFSADELAGYAKAFAAAPQLLEALRGMPALEPALEPAPAEPTAERPLSFGDAVSIDRLVRLYGAGRVAAWAYNPPDLKAAASGAPT